MKRKTLKKGIMLFVSGSKDLSAILRLEGCAERIPRCVRVTRAYRDLVGGAAGIHIVIIAVLHVALDTLDVLAATGVFIGLFFHFKLFLSSLRTFLQTFALFGKSRFPILYSTPTLQKSYC